MNWSLRYGFFCWFIFGGQSAFAQSSRPIQVAGRLDYDSFFGFSPTLVFSRPLDSLHEVSAYGIFYPNPAFFGVETGITLRVSSPRKNWVVVPGAGLVSGSVFVAGRPFTLAEGYLGSLATQYEWRSWYGQGYGVYYGVLQRRLADTYDFGLFALQVGRIVTENVRIGLVYERLGLVRLPRNRADPSQFDVVRVGIGTTLNLPYELTLQLVSGLTHGVEEKTFLQLSLSRMLTRRWVPRTNRKQD